jgi:hypothetical protein
VGDGSTREPSFADAARRAIGDELRRVRESVRSRALVEREPGAVLGAAPPVRTPTPIPTEPQPEPPPPPPRPDATEVNALWRAEPRAGGGRLKGLWRRLVEAALAPRLEAQQAWNARQVQLDNALLDYVDARLHATHRHYDAVLGITGRHLGEVDERHLILQEELVSHVHDLVARIDLVLGESERGRASFEHALRELRDRVAALEEALKRG